jgi:hypothetical protein
MAEEKTVRNDQKTFLNNTLFLLKSEHKKETKDLVISFS